VNSLQLAVILCRIAKKCCSSETLKDRAEIKPTPGRKINGKVRPNRQQVAG